MEEIFKTKDGRLTPLNMRQFHRVMLATPERKNDEKILEVLLDKTVKVKFNWNEECGGWELCNPLIVESYDYKISIYCPECKDKQDHTVNIDLTKVRCGGCKKVSNFCV